MSTLEKTIHLLNELPEKEIEIIYNYVQFISAQREAKTTDSDNSLDDIFEHIVGIIPDTGKTLDEYREERLCERYEVID